jgi:succinyl-diaminopimelate desuccinylase
VVEPGPFTETVANAVAEVTGRAPVLSTTGGTSDARFIKNYCPVAELGLAGATMHKADECASLEDIEILTRIYQAILEDYFANPPRG